MPFSLLWRGKGKVVVIEAMGVGAGHGPQRTLEDSCLVWETGDRRGQEQQEAGVQSQKAA